MQQITICWNLCKIRTSYLHFVLIYASSTKLETNICILQKMQSRSPPLQEFSVSIIKYEATGIGFEHKQLWALVNLNLKPYTA